MTTRQTDLRQAFDSAGAVFDSGSGRLTHFGDPEAELDSLLNGAGVVWSNSSSFISHTGPDALDLLHRLTTNDLLSLVQGRAAATVITSDKGRIVDVVTVAVKASDSLLLLSDSPDSSAAMEFIDRYTIIEDAKLTDRTREVVRFTLLGPNVVATLKALMGVDIENGSTMTASLNGAEIDMVRFDWTGLPLIFLMVNKSLATSVWESLVDSGIAPVGDHALHTARVMIGVPFFGAELTDRVNPLEAGLESLVSFTKGCYIGQEVIARLDSYDKLQRRLMGLVSTEVPSAGSGLTSADGKRAGEITSVAQLAVSGERISLGLVRKGHWDPGTVLLAGDTEVTVAELPFAR